MKNITAYSDELDFSSLKFEELEDPEKFFKSIFYRKKNSYEKFFVKLCNTQNIQLLLDNMRYLLELRSPILQNYHYQILSNLSANFTYYNDQIENSYVCEKVFDILNEKKLFDDIFVTYSDTDNQSFKDLLQRKTTSMIFNVVFRNNLELYKRFMSIFGEKKCLTAYLDEFDEFVCSYAKFDMFEYLFQTRKFGSLFSFEDLDKLLYFEARKFDSSPEAQKRLAILLKYGASFKYSIEKFALSSQIFDSESVRSSFYKEVEKNNLGWSSISERLREQYDLTPSQIYLLMDCERVVNILSVFDNVDIQHLMNIARIEQSKPKHKLNF